MLIPPLLIVPFIIYNIVAFAFAGNAAMHWSSELFTISMVTGAVWSLTLGDLLIVLALVLLFFEVLKSTRTGNPSVLDHGLSTLVFVAYLVEFLIVPSAATSVFFTCLVMSLIDLVAGFSVSIRAAGRDVSFN